MATADKDSQVIHRAVRVLDEIESRIHELREELEANGMASPRRGRKKDDAAHDEDHESHPQGRGKGKAGDENLHGAAKAAHEAKTGGHDDHDDHSKGRAKADAKHDDDREPHGQGRVKHPETDKRLKGHEDGGVGHADAKHDDDREPHGQGRVKHPETDKRLKGHKDDDDAKAEKAEPASKS